MRIAGLVPGARLYPIDSAFLPRSHFLALISVFVLRSRSQCCKNVGCKNVAKQNGVEMAKNVVLLASERLSFGYPGEYPDHTKPLYHDLRKVEAWRVAALKDGLRVVHGEKGAGKTHLIELLQITFRRAGMTSLAVYTEDIPQETFGIGPEQESWTDFIAEAIKQHRPKGFFIDNFVAGSPDDILSISKIMEEANVVGVFTMPTNPGRWLWRCDHLLVENDQSRRLTYLNGEQEEVLSGLTYSDRSIGPIRRDRALAVKMAGERVFRKLLHDHLDKNRDSLEQAWESKMEQLW